MPESGDVLGPLMARVSRARAESERLMTRSAILVTARRAVTDPDTMVKRCAWCNRLLLAYVWVPEDEVPDFVGDLLDGRTTHGICADCVHRLEDEGESHVPDR